MSDRKPAPNPCVELEIGLESSRLEYKKEPKVNNSTIYWFLALIFAALTAAHWVAFPFAVGCLLISHRFYRRENATNSRD